MCVCLSACPLTPSKLFVELSSFFAQTSITYPGVHIYFVMTVSQRSRSPEVKKKPFISKTVNFQIRKLSHSPFILIFLPRVGRVITFVIPFFSINLTRIFFSSCTLIKQPHASLFTL